MDPVLPRMGLGMALITIVVVASARTTSSAEESSPAVASSRRKLRVASVQTKRRLVDWRIKDADEAMIDGCEYLGIVVGKSGWGGLAAGAANKGTMRSAKKKAAKMGATHIVFGNFDNASGMKVSTRQARAYRCPEPAEGPESPPNQGAGADG